MKRAKKQLAKMYMSKYGWFTWRCEIYVQLCFKGAEWLAPAVLPPRTPMVRRALAVVRQCIKHNLRKAQGAEFRLVCGEELDPIECSFPQPEPEPEPEPEPRTPHDRQRRPRHRKIIRCGPYFVDNLYRWTEDEYLERRINPFSLVELAHRYAVLDMGVKAGGVWPGKATP